MIANCSSGSAVVELQATTYRKVDRRLLPIVFICYVLAYLDRVNVGFAKLQMMSDLGLSDAAFGLGAGIFFVGYFFFEVPSNLLLRRFGARTWIARIMFSWGILSAATMWARSEWSFYLLRFLLGIAEAGFFPGVVFYLTLWYPERLRSTRIASLVSAIAVSGVVGGPVSGLIMRELSGRCGLAGWQWLFLIEGIPSILMSVWVWFYLESDIRQATWLQQEEKEVLLANLDFEDRHKTQSTLKHALASGRVYALCAIYFSLMIGLYGISFWLPSMIKGLGVNSYLGIGLVSAIPYAFAIIGMAFLSRSSDRAGERRWHYVLNVVVGSLGLAASGLLGNHPALAIACLAIGTLGVLGSMPIFWSVPPAFLSGTAAAAGIGLINSVGNLGGYVGSNVPAWVQKVFPGQAAPLVVIAAILILGAGTAFFTMPKGRQTLP